MPHSANQSILPVAVAACLVALGLTLVPTTMTNTIRAAVHDATLPGHHLLAFARLQFDAAKDSLTSADDSQQQIADSTRISQADISRIEAGGWVPPDKIQQRLARLLETTPEEIFGVRYEHAS